jgi:hypothetical protein
MQTTKIDLDANYRVKSWMPVAVYIYGYPQVWEPATYLAKDEDGNEYEQEDECGEGEWVEDTECGQIVVVMVGDDHKHTVDVDDLELLDGLDYCAECGQIGCCHDGRDRS